MTDKEAVIAEARRFADKRDEIFDRAKAKAGTAIAKAIDIDMLMQDPETYLRLLFVKVGMGVVKAFRPEAEAAGVKHAERFQQA